MSEEPVFLRALEMEDAQRIHQWHNDPALYDSLVGTFWHVSRTNVEDWLRKRQAFSREEINLAICTRQSSEHVGNIYLRDIDWIARRAELHIFIGAAEKRSQGYGQAAVRLLVDHAFGNLGLQRLYLYVLADNRSALRVYEKCGFIVEGTLRRHACKNGAFKDVMLLGLCAEGR